MTIQGLEYLCPVFICLWEISGIGVEKVLESSSTCFQNIWAPLLFSPSADMNLLRPFLLRVFPFLTLLQKHCAVTIYALPEVHRTNASALPGSCMPAFFPMSSMKAGVFCNRNVKWLRKVRGNQDTRPTPEWILCPQVCMLSLCNKIYTCYKEWFAWLKYSQ